MVENEYFAKDEIIETMKNAEDYSENDFYDLCEAMFNRDYITGKHEASEALATYANDEELDGYETALEGEVGAAVLVERYELDQFASIRTPLFNEPEKLANRVEYIRGERLFNKALNKANLYTFEETTEENLAKFAKAVEDL